MPIRLPLQESQLVGKCGTGPDRLSNRLQAGHAVWFPGSLVNTWYPITLSVVGTPRRGKLFQVELISPWTVVYLFGTKSVPTAEVVAAEVATVSAADESSGECGLYLQSTSCSAGAGAERAH
jgi:hypothetical protein